MKRLFNVTLLASLVVCATMLMTQRASAQAVTTGSLGGQVEDQQGGRLPGATVQAIHVLTGTTYQAITQSDGRFTILNVRVGNYTVKVTLPGFRDAEQKDVVVSLGEEKAVEFKLQLSSVSETVTVVAEVTPIDLSRAGAAANISNAVKESLPTITRSINDIVRVSPLFSTAGSGAGDGASVVSVAGTIFRYNSLQIDGASNNDLFGLAGSAGTPGGVTETQPISLDAIQEIQLVVSPYDVRQGGFSGGGINAVTKSGTNTLHGTAFFFGRNEDWVGKGITGTRIATFKDKQGGASLGGRLVQNRAFFFGTVDYGRRLKPTGVCITGCANQFNREASVDRFLSILSDRYGYTTDENPKREFGRTTDSDKVFVRTDFNVAAGHQLTVRHNFVDGLTDVGFPTATLFRTPDAYYRFRSKTNSTVAQLNSTFGMGVNELRVALTRVRDRRGAQPFETRPFPQVTVDVAGSSVQVVAGREQFSMANELDQDIVEVTDSYTRVQGAHAFTVGTHNEFFKFRNLFIRDNFGTYRFSNLDNFEAGIAQQFDYSFSATSDPKQASKFKVNQLSFYAGDQWRVKPTLTITFGTRIDVVRFPDKPTANPVAQDNFGYATDIVPNNILWSPRVGFNWNRSASLKEQIRGGVGMFAGRPPYVWISNQYGNTGIDFRRIGASFNANNTIPFVPDPNNQPTTVTGASGSSFTNEIDLIDPDFKYPTILRGNLAYEKEVWWDFVGSVELVFSKNIRDIKYQNLNLVQTGTRIDGRPVYSRRITSLSDVIFLTNTDQGSAWTLAFEAKRPFRNGFFLSTSYSYGEAHSIMDGTSDQAASNWGFVYTPGDPNNTPLTRSDFDPGHRFTVSTAYDFSLGRGYMATASIFYSGQSGRPYSLIFSNDINGDGRTTNDLLYLPTSTDPLAYTGGLYQDLLLFMQREDCTASQIGTITERNSCRNPWTNTLDGRVSVQLPFRRVRAEVTLDVINLINLFDSKGGQNLYSSFKRLGVISGTLSGTPANLTGMSLSTITSSSFTRYFRDDLRSRWQMQLGGRVRF
jgi:hypothetical protein